MLTSLAWNKHGGPQCGLELLTTSNLTSCRTVCGDWVHEEDADEIVSGSADGEDFKRISILMKRHSATGGFSRSGADGGSSS